MLPPAGEIMGPPQKLSPVDVLVLAVVEDVAHVTICPLLACQSKAPHFAAAILMKNT